MELPLTSVTIFTVTVWYERIFSDTCISRQQTVHISRQINAVVASSIICGTRQSDSGSRQSKRWLKIYGGAFWRHTFRSCWVSYMIYDQLEREDSMRYVEWIWRSWSALLSLASFALSHTQAVLMSSAAIVTVTRIHTATHAKGAPSWLRPVAWSSLPIFFLLVHQSFNRKTCF